MLSTSTTSTPTSLTNPASQPVVVHVMNGGLAAVDGAAAPPAAGVAAVAWQPQQQQLGQQQDPQAAQAAQSQRQPVPAKKKLSGLFFQRFTLKSLLHSNNNNNNNNSIVVVSKLPKSGGVLRLTTSRGKIGNASNSQRRSAAAATASTTLRHTSTLALEDAASAALNNTSVDGGAAAAATTEQQQQQALNVLQWLETTCPGDLLPGILAYCGPQITAMLGRTNRYWKTIVFDDAEATWKVMCQDLYKWKEGDAEPASWMAHYRQNPCVPIDYSSVQAALQLAAPTPTASTSRYHHKTTSATQQQLQQVRSLKIWMRPGRYHLQQAIQVQAPPGVELVIETMQLPANIFQKPPTIHHHHRQDAMEQVAEQPLVRQQQQQQTRTPPRRSASNAFLQFIRFGGGTARGSNPAAAAFEEAEATERSETGGAADAAAADVLDVFGGRRDPPDSSSHHHHSQQRQRAAAQQQQPTHATLVLRTRRHNEPAVCVRQGKVTLTNLEIQHFAHGLDIWNGNAAIQVQPATTNNNNEPPLPRLVEAHRPTAILQGCQVTSSSGRGIVNIDGGHVTIRQCAIYNCAATGVYIGGPGTQAILQDSDVVRNGVGNYHHTTTGNTNSNRRGGGAGQGIARGHSGVYLEQGSAHINNCNISENTLTGISAVSPDNAILHLSDTSLIANGTFQLELPSIGSNARDQSRIENNQLLSSSSSSTTSQAAASSAGSRGSSGLLPASAAVSISRTTNEPTAATMRG